MNEGFLAAYLTGELSKEELQELEQLIAEDKEVKREYLSLQKVLELLSFQHGFEVSDNLKQRVMQNPQVMKYLKPEESTRVIVWRFLVAASVSLAMVAGMTAYFYWAEFKETDQRLAELTARNIELAEGFQQVNHELNGMRNSLAVLVSPEFSRIILQGTENAEDAKTVIYWNAQREELYLNSANLAALPQHQQYQLWALIDGKPVDAGVFDAAAGSFQIMKNIAAADAFAVTVEQTGGAESPTLSTMQVYGEVKNS